jgi:hypothetical protein
MPRRGRRGLPDPAAGGVAVVTGASSGIGAEFAHALAERGHDLLLAARRRERLDAMAGALRRRGVRVEVAACDLSERAGVEALLARVEELGLRAQVLVNNAGFGVWGPFLDEPLPEQMDQVRVHVDAVVALTHALARRMRDHGEGAIVNVASSAALQTVPYLAVYSASKAFVLSFSKALDAELRGSGVSVIAVNPGPVATEFGAVSGLAPEREPAPLVPARQVAEETLRALARGRRSVVPGWRMRVSAASGRVLPDSLALPLLERLYRPGGGR